MKDLPSLFLKMLPGVLLSGLALYRSPAYAAPAAKSNGDVAPPQGAPIQAVLTSPPMVPGSFIRVRQGDTVEFHLKNHPSSKMPHNIDLRGVTGPGGGAASSFTAPGHEYYVMQGDFYPAGTYREKGLQAFDMEKAIDERPTYVLFNGAEGALTGNKALKAKTNV
ncbi:hypothetical protein AAKU55_003369 [Oxalobacteraceae bacterium GrIS 1.11]